MTEGKFQLLSFCFTWKSYPSFYPLLFLKKITLKDSEKRNSTIFVDVDAVSNDVGAEACRVCWWGELLRIYKNRNARECNGFKDERAYVLSQETANRHPRGHTRVHQARSAGPRRKNQLLLARSESKKWRWGREETTRRSTKDEGRGFYCMRRRETRLTKVRSWPGKRTSSFSSI